MDYDDKSSSHNAYKFDTVITFLETSDNININVVKTKLLNVELKLSNNKKVLHQKCPE